MPELLDLRTAALNLMEDAVEARKQAERALIALRSSEARHAFLLMLSDAMRPIADPIEIQKLASSVLGRYLEVDRVIYAGIDGDEAVVSASYVNGVSRLPERMRFENLGAHLIDSYRDGETLVVDDVDADPRFSAEASAALRAFEMAAFVSVPLMKDRNWIGAFSAHSATPRKWRPEEIDLIRETAERTWSSVARAQAEDALRASEERMRSTSELFFSLIEGAPLGVYLIDDTFRLTHVSAASQKVFENVRPLIGSDFADVLRSIWEEPFASEAIKIFRHTLETGEPYHSHDTTKARADIDDIESYDWQIKRITLPNGRFAVVCYFLDLTQRVRAEAGRRRSEERLRLIMESFSDIAITTTSPEGIVENWNTGAKTIFGYAAEEIVGRSAELLFTPEDRAANVPASEMQVALETGRASDERWHIRKDGSRFYASGVMVPLLEGDRLLGYAKIARDLTKDKQAEAALKAAHENLETRVGERTAELAQANISLRQEMSERQKSEQERVNLLRRVVAAQEEERSRISRDMHDQLGQQLTALRLKIASLIEDKSMGPKLEREIASLQETAARLDSEISFLAWELRPAALDDLGFVPATKAFVAEWSRHHGIPVEFHDGRLEGTRFDPSIETNLYRILQEALNNVYKHARANSVNVVVEMRRSNIVLVIEDDGIGFSPEEQRPRTDSGGGMGLIGVRERAAIVGGTVEIESALGNGTTIFVRVPVAPVE